MARIAITGSSGMIGTALRERLTTEGHSVLRVIRGNPTDPAALWNPDTGWVRDGALEGVEAVVGLTGASIGEGRWTEARKKVIAASRVDANRLLVEHLVQLEPRPTAFVSASAVGYYGDRGDDQLTEESPRGTGFLAELVEAWERETFRAREAGIRTVATRFGVVMSRRGGAFPRMALPFKLGLGGRLGSGRQWMAMVSLEDAIGALVYALDSELEGPVNVTAEPVRNVDFTRALGKALHRPAILPVPAFGLKALLGGQAAEELLLASQRVVTGRLEESGYHRQHPDMESVLAAALA